jgi:hypothetical protein
MDEIDNARNAMVKQVNNLFTKYNIACLPLITLSSDQVKLSERNIEVNDWNRYYIREHKGLLPFV